MPKIKVTEAQLRILLQAEGCDCSDKQWSRRQEHCTVQWIRCRGRMGWKRCNDKEYQRGLAQLGHSHPAHDKRNRKSPPCPECSRWLKQLDKELFPGTTG